MDLDKIEAIMNWPTTKNVSNARSFLGMVGYYKGFIEDFSKVAYPITSLQKIETKFLWTTKCEESFQRLKHLLITAPILKITYPYGDFVVCIYACKEDLGGILLQDNHVVCYESKKLKEHERNYATHDLELTAIIHALKVWRH